MAVVFDCAERVRFKCCLLFEMHWPTGPSNKLKTSTGRKCQLCDVHVSVKYLIWTRLKTEVKKTPEKNPANSHFFGN